MSSQTDVIIRRQRRQLFLFVGIGTVAFVVVSIVVIFGLLYGAARVADIQHGPEVRAEVNSMETFIRNHYSFFNNASPLTPQVNAFLPTPDMAQYLAANHLSNPVPDTRFVSTASFDPIKMWSQSFPGGQAYAV